VNGMRIQMPRFADDIAILAPDEVNLKTALESLDDILTSNYKIKINRIKTEVMVCSKHHENINIKMDDAIIPQFKYRGFIFTKDGKNKEDIIQQVKEVKVMFSNKKQLLCLNNLSLEIKNILIRIYIWNVALYGSEIWTL
jgi:hypothetical protein